MTAIGITRRAPVRAVDISRSREGRARVLHSVGHLHRGGIESWLYQIVQMSSDEFEHHVLVWTDEEEHYTNDFRAAGAEILPIRGYRNPLKLRAGLRSVMREHGPYDILHTHGTHYHGLVMLLCAEAGIPVRIAHSHTDIRPVLTDSNRAYQLYAALGHRLLNSFATRGLAVSRPAAESMFGPGWKTDPRWQIHYCGIDLGAFDRPADPALRAELGLPAGHTIVGHVGRFEPQKNHAFLVDVAGELARRDEPVHFLLIGAGSLRDGLQDEIGRRGIASMFTFVENSTEVTHLMTSAMDAFVFPSLYEGLGLAAVEAQAAGLPVVLSEHIPEEAIVDRARVRTVPLSEGAAAWADAIVDLGKFRQEDGETFRELLSKGPFNVKTSASRLAAIYTETMRTSLRSRRRA